MNESPLDDPIERLVENRVNERDEEMIECIQDLLNAKAEDHEPTNNMNGQCPKDIELTTEAGNAHNNIRQRGLKFYKNILAIR